jgi:hypothetical protein
VPQPNQVETNAWAAAAPDTVWSVLADTTAWPSWTGFDAVEVERPGEAAPHGIGAIHRFRTKMLVTREEVLAFDAPTRYEYRLLSGLPLRDYHAEVVLTPERGGTTIVWRSRFLPGIPGSGPLARRFVRAIITRMTTALAREAERVTS